jgi:hypothetical protein
MFVNLGHVFINYFSLYIPNPATINEPYSAAMPMLGQSYSAVQENNCLKA